MLYKILEIGIEIEIVQEERLTSVSENNVVYRTKLSEMEMHNKSFEALSENIFRLSMGTLIETVPSLLQ